MSRRCKRRRVMAEMNVVPYIDVMLVLLVIFMVTAPMLQTGVQIDLPDENAKSAKTLPSKGSQVPLTISVDETGSITLEDGSQTFEKISEDELVMQMTGKLGARNMRTVYIRADSNIAYEVLMRVMLAAKKAGVRKLGLVTDIETNNSQ